ncbi:prepilin-type N-terminal cleavage/methylation domain-containing protein [Photobacterium swingsii]|uniref:Prepilin-type N-terminal cleavage/methylation domain-containing protein n=1 Tax=Photobacterium swingsii TaxID=680026 RepID=A0A2T3P6G3_9GAMM|nr:prepilin-type N-terminal cleavage/methylation domain-containing protein [Photobacterium swingsii]PSW24160.1 hypothetical protein C9I94_12540 [Photobacterium swingsii]
MYDWKKNQGITLLELLFTVAIIGIILASSVPSFETLVVNNQIKAKSEELFRFVRLAKYEAVKRNKKVEVYYDSTSPGYYCLGMRGVGENITCSNQSHTYSLLKINDDIKFKVKTVDGQGNIADISNGALFSFSPQTGKSSANKRVLFQSNTDTNVVSGVRVTNVGLVNPCSDQAWGGKMQCTSG